jgi:integrase
MSATMGVPMSVFKRGSMWCIGYSQNGKWVRKTISTSKHVAMLAEKEQILRSVKGEYLGILEPKKILFENLCHEYLQFSKVNKNPQSYRRDITSLKNLLLIFNGKYITTITASDLEHYKNLRINKVKPGTINRELSCIKHMFSKAIHWGYLKDNQLRSVTKLKEPPGRLRYLQDGEEERLLAFCPEYTKPIVIFALNTGMRKSEILYLKWQDVDLKTRWITVRHTKNNEARRIPINEILFTSLAAIRSKMGSHYVFSHANGKPFIEIYYGFKAACRRAGIEDFRFHDLRHTFASRLAIKGVDIRVIQELLGHKTLTMTMRYSHLSHQALRDAVDKLSPIGYDRDTDVHHTNTTQAVLSGR